MLKKNDEHIIEITGVGSQGEGVGKINDFAVFVPFAIQGEKIRVKLLKVLNNYAHGKLLQVISPSESRTVPSCPHFYKCGGCSLQHMTYEKELEFKQQKVADCLKRIGGIDTEILPIIGSDDNAGYRNKGLFPVTNEGVGFYAPRSHRVIPVKCCEIQDEKSNIIVDVVKQFMGKFSISPYDESSHRGHIRYVYTRVAGFTGEVMVCIVTRTKELPYKNELVKMLQSANIGIVSIFQNINPKRTNVALGEKTILLWGKEAITDKIGDLLFKISPKSFYQVNAKQTKKLYDEVVKAGQFTGSERVFDLYCGIGTISLYIADFVKEVIGIEVVGEAVKDAVENARINNKDNVKFYHGAAEDLTKNLGKADVVIIDPPRKGCDKRLLQTLKDMSSEKIIYVSCNPATLARDLKIIQSFGYKTQYARPVDMFPRTAHVETVVLMSRVEKQV